MPPERGELWWTEQQQMPRVMLNAGYCKSISTKDWRTRNSGAQAGSNSQLTLLIIRVQGTNQEGTFQDKMSAGQKIQSRDILKVLRLQMLFDNCSSSTYEDVILLEERHYITCLSSNQWDTYILRNSDVSNDNSLRRQRWNSTSVFILHLWRPWSQVVMKLSSWLWV